MSASLHPLPLEGSKARDHYDVTLAQLSAWLAEAEFLGGYRAIEGRENEAGRVAYLAMQELTRPTRERFWEARLRGELERRG